MGICSTISGKADIQIAEVWQIIFAKLSGQTAALEEIKKSTVSIVWNIRLPRIIAGILVGMGLAIAGVIFQAVLMNPLADSFTMGVSPGAAFGASIALFIGMFFNLDISISLFAFLGAMGSLLVVLYLAKVDGYATANNLIICGIIISSVLSAGISFIKYGGRTGRRDCQLADRIFSCPHLGTGCANCALVDINQYWLYSLCRLFKYPFFR